MYLCVCVSVLGGTPHNHTRTRAHTLTRARRKLRKNPPQRQDLQYQSLAPAAFREAPIPADTDPTQVCTYPNRQQHIAPVLYPSAASRWKHMLQLKCCIEGKLLATADISKSVESEIVASSCTGLPCVFECCPRRFLTDQLNVRRS